MYVYIFLTCQSFLYSFIKYKLAFKVTDQCRSEVGLNYDCKLKNYQKHKALQALAKYSAINIVPWHYFLCSYLLMLTIGNIFLVPYGLESTFTVFPCQSSS